MKRIIFFLSFLLIAGGCEFLPHSGEHPQNDADLTGYWVQEGWTDSTQIFRRVSELQTDEYCLGFLPSGRFIENKNSGFCGTPPIVYATYEGEWVETIHGKIMVQTRYWGGDMSYEITIVTMYPQELELSIKMMNQFP